MRIRVIGSIFGSVLCACVIVAAFNPAFAQGISPAEITVTVVDSSSAKPLGDAEIFLLGGDVPQSSLSNAAGVLTFQNVQPGLYKIGVQRSGYIKTEVTEFEVNESARIAIVVKLVPALKTIGSVTARSSISVSAQTIDVNSAERKVSQSLKDALSKVAGVSVDDSTYENNAFNVSLRNHDSSQTGVSLNGAPVGAGARQGVSAAQDLFSGANIDFNPTAGYLGGTINFQTLRPTKTWKSDEVFTIGNVGSSLYSGSVTGSVGRLGLAFVHAASGKDLPLSGLLFTDQSGITQHVGGSTRRGDLARFSYSLTKRTTLGALGYITNGSSDEICSEFVTLLPCSYGSSASTHGRYGYANANVTSLIGNLSVTASAASFFGRYDQTQPNRSLNGVAAPYAFRGTYNGINYGVNGSIAARRHTANFGVYTSTYRSTASQTYAGIPVTLAQPVQVTTQTYFYDKIKANEKLAITHGVSLAKSTGSGGALIASETVDWTPAKNDVFEAGVAAGSSQPNFGTSTVISDPLTASYDCYNGSTFVDGPQDPATSQSSLSYNFAWQHKFVHGNWNVSLYRQNAYGQSVRAAVPVQAIAPGLFPGGLANYLNQLQRVWASPAVCGSIPFDPSRVYVSQSLTGIGQVNQGFDISGQLLLGRISLFPTYAVGSTFISTLDPRLEFPNSFYATGRQLPHRPLRTAGLTVDGLIRRAKLEWLANAQFTDVNNAGNLPAYTVYNAGLVFHARLGTLTFVESNIFGNYTGLFTTYLGENPAPLKAGGSFAYSTTPLPPRQWSITWRLPWQQRAPAASPSPQATQSPKPQQKQTPS